VYRLVTPNPLPDLISRTRWYIFIRWFALLAIAMPTVLSLFIVDGLSAQVVRDALLGIVAIASNSIFFITSRIIKSEASYKKLAISLIITDILLISGVIFINGGIESRSVILYTIPILFSAALFGSSAIYKTTFSIIAIYDFMIIGEYLNLFHTVGAFDPWEHTYFSYVVNTVISFSAIFLIVGVIVDFITKIMAVKEQQVSASLAVLKFVQEIAKFGSWEWDVKEDVITWSDELFRIFGLKPSSSAPDYKNYIKSLHPDDRKLVNQAVQRSLKTAQPYSIEHRVIMPDGSVRYIHGKGHPISDKSGKVIKIFGTAQDITKAKQLDEARNEFVSLSSHQLRTPATAVKQYLGLLLEGYAGKLSEDQNVFLRTAYDSNNRQLTIVDDLLNTAQIDSGNLKLRKSNIALVELLNQIIDEQLFKFKDKKQTIEFNTKYKRMDYVADERRLRMAIENLVDNAHKYSPANGRIKINLSKNSKSIKIEIKDNGIGIAKKDLPKVFKKFSRVDHADSVAQSGTGLGLYLVKKIIVLHGGKIQVQSEINKGTKFIITLPISKPPKA
jgi:PAS domain S-box-containing protein